MDPLHARLSELIEAQELLNKLSDHLTLNTSFVAILCNAVMQPLLLTKCQVLAKGLCISSFNTIWEHMARLNARGGLAVQQTCIFRASNCSALSGLRSSSALPARMRHCALMSSAAAASLPCVCPPSLSDAACSTPVFGSHHKQEQKCMLQGVLLSSGQAVKVTLHKTPIHQDIHLLGSSKHVMW